MRVVNVVEVRDEDGVLEHYRAILNNEYSSNVNYVSDIIEGHDFPTVIRRVKNNWEYDELICVL